MLAHSLSSLDLRIQSETKHFASRDLANLLSVAVNLEELRLILTYTAIPVTSFQYYLGGCPLPKLKSLVLVKSESTFDELLLFLQSCPKLERSVFLTHTLRSGQWKEAFEQMRACENLKDVLLDDLKGGWTTRMPWTRIPRIYHDCYGRVRDFFSSKGGAKLFTQSELDRYDAGRAANVPMTWTYDPDSTEVYNELHP